MITVLAVLFLAFTVLGWGTVYKLSLYDPPVSPSTNIPAAKLLSQKERPSSLQAVEGVLPAIPNHQPLSYSPAIMIVVLTFGLRLAVSAWMREIGMEDSRRQRSAPASFFSFRPPPALLPSN
jgi:hypothetical protein